MKLKKKLSTGLVLMGLFIAGTGFAQNGDQTSEAVSDEELKEFSNLQMGVQKINQEGQQVMVKGIQDNDLTVQRYQEISQAKNKGEEPEMTEQEATAFEKSDKIVQEQQKSMRTKMDELIEKSSMSKERYIEISRLVQQDQALQQRLREMQQ
ncbi:MAG: DUF4168 domain-containing protein [Bacteroidales bacterium]